MKIQSDTLNSLFVKYKVLFDKEVITKRSEFDAAIQEIEDQLDGYFDWEKLASADLLDKQLSSLIQSSLKLHTDSNEFRFDKVNTKLACHQFNQQFSDAMRLKLASPASEQGLQEKFLKSQSYQSDEITNTDIKRQITATHMNGVIGVVEPTADAIGMQIVNAKHQYESQKGDAPHKAYPVAMMIDLNPDGPSKWASVVININPETNTATWDVASRSELTGSERSKLIQAVDDGIQLKQLSEVTGLAIEAYPDIKLSKPNLSTVDGGSLKVLHGIYEHELMTDIVRERDAAQSFKASGEGYQQAFIDNQISSIAIQPKILQLFSPVSDTCHELVDGELKEVKLNQDKLTFPSREPTDSPLTAQDYQIFILRLNEKFVSGGIEQGLQKLDIRLFNPTDIQGLGRLKGNMNQMPCKRLDVHLPPNIEATDKQAFMFNLKLALTNLNALNLQQLNLSDAGQVLNESDIADLTDFVEHNGIGIDITLPKEFALSVEQRKIDIASSKFRLERNATNYANRDDKVALTKVAREIRTRPQISSSNVSIDIELQQEVQVEVAVESSNERQSDVPSDGEADIWDFERFKEAMQNPTGSDGFSSESNSHLISAKDSQLKQLWGNWFGCLNDNDFKRGIKITKPALEELLQHADKFEYGIGLTQSGNTYKSLPPGFTVKTKNSDTYLEFDAGLKRISKPNPLAVNTKKASSAVNISADLISKWCESHDEHPFAKQWQHASETIPYDKAYLKTLQRSFPDILKMPEEQAEQLFELCQTPAQLDFLVPDTAKMKPLYQTDSSLVTRGATARLIELFGDDHLAEIKSYIKTSSEVTPLEDESLLKQFLSASDYKHVENIKEKLDSINSDGLLQVYLNTGSQGIKDISTLLNGLGDELADYQSLNETIFEPHGNYEQILTPEFQETVQAVASLPENEKAFFNRLLAQHAKHHSDVNLSEMFESFNAFKMELKDLSPDGKPFKLPEELTFEDVKSMPVALARITAVVEHVAPENRQAQLLESTKLDLSSQGAVQITNRNFGSFSKRWNFLSAEMNFSPKQEAWQSHTRNYRVPSNWKKVDEEPWTPSDWVTPIRDDDPDALSQNFMRFAAFQSKNGSLPLAYYKHVDQVIRSADDSWSSHSKQIFYLMAAGSSVGESNVDFVKSTEEAIKDFDILFDKMDKPPNPGGVGYSLAGGKDNMRMQVMRLLTQLDNQPPAPVLTNLVSLISSSLGSVFGAAANAKKLDSANNSLRAMVNEYGNNVYKGLSCYNDSEYEKPKLFYKHMATVEAIHHNDELPRHYKSALIQLISTFHLDADHGLDDVIEAIQKSQKPYELYPLLDVLKNVSPEDYDHNNPLTHKQLIQLVDTTLSKEDPVKAANDVIKEAKFNGKPLTSYFNKRFIRNLGKKEVPFDTKENIEKSFDEPLPNIIEDILLRFTGNTDSTKYNDVVEKLKAITKPLSKLESNLFLQKLYQNGGLYSSDAALADEDNPFMRLLDKIDESGSPDDFLNFLASDRKLFDSLPSTQKERYYQGEPLHNQGLDQKALLYLNEIAPTIRAKDLPLSELEITPRLHEWLLKTSMDELTGSSDVVNPDTALMEAYLQKSNDTLQCLSPDAEDHTLQLDDLQEQIDTLLSDSKLSETDRKALTEFKQQTVDIQTVDGVKLSDLMEVAGNPAANSLLRYLNNQMDDLEKEAFESEHDDFLTKIKQSPVLTGNKDLLPVLFEKNNYFLLKNVMQGDSLQALKSPDLLSDPTEYNAFIEALEKDTKALEKFKTSAEQVESAVKKHKEASTKYSATVSALVDKIAGLINENPIAKTQLLNLFDNLTAGYDPQSGQLMKALHDYSDTLLPVFGMIEDKNVVLSLCMQFNGDEHSPQELVDLIQTIKQNVDDVDDQKLLIETAVKLLNNEKGYILNDSSIEAPEKRKDFQTLCQIASDDPRLLETLQTFYDKPPYPDLTQIIDIHKDALTKPDYQKAISEKATAFDIRPCHRECGEEYNKVNGFDAALAAKKLGSGEFKGYSADQEKLERFQKKTEDMRELSSQQLLDKLAEFRETDEPNMEDLVAVTAELFYRSKGKDDPLSDGTHKLGSSMEINTTQYLAILSSLETEGNVTSQIGTGEGKSRIMMISNVCQWALGNTVDFVTSDAQLATRDYVEYQAFFNMVGAETSMIFAGSDPSSYKVGGINFSDPSNLSLFRNKAKSLGKGADVFDPDPTKRALNLDEADKTYFDVADTRFNFSKEGDASIQNMEWVYPTLMAYFEQESVNVPSDIAAEGRISPMTLFYQNVDASRDSFLNYAKNHSSKQDFARLQALSEQQIEQWQVSAVTAAQLEFNKDYVIAADQLISTPKGPKIASEAQLLFANRVAKGSKFSFGVHQCLHARLNRMRREPENIHNPDLKQVLTGCEQDFFVAGEKQIVYTSTSKNLIDDYREGTLKAVTGTAGSKIERAEASKLFGMKFIDVPRHRGMKRVDHGLQVCKDESEQFKALIKDIQIARERNQPILVIAETDEESAKLYEKLQRHFAEDIQRIHSQLDPKQEKALTNEAGLPGMITVSTDMIGRGTDISLRNRTLKNGTEVSAKTHGLAVRATYLPRVRDLEQIIGRSGRFGAEGDTKIIADEKRLLKRIGKDKLPKNFKKDVEGFIRREQAKMDRNKQVERLIKNLKGDFVMEMQRNFNDEMLSQVPVASRQSLSECWTTFLEKSDKSWNEVWPKIQSELKKPNITEEEITNIELKLAEFKQSTQQEWTALTSKVKDLDVTCLDGETKAHDVLNQDVPNLELGHDLKKIYTGFKVRQENAPHDKNRFKKIFGGSFAGLGAIGAGIGIALVATGVLAPLGIGLLATVGIIAAAGAVVAAAGMVIGAIADAFSKPETIEVLDIDLDDTAEQTKVVDELEANTVDENIEIQSSFARMQTMGIELRSEPVSSDLEDELDLVQNYEVDTGPTVLTTTKPKIG